MTSPGEKPSWRWSFLYFLVVFLMLMAGKATVLQQPGVLQHSWLNPQVRNGLLSGHRLGCGENGVGYLVRMGNHRRMTALDRGDGCAHPLSEEVLHRRRNHLIVFGDDVPGWERLPGWITEGYVARELAGRNRLLRGRHYLCLSRIDIWREELKDTRGIKPQITLLVGADGNGSSGRWTCGDKLLHGLALVRRKGRLVDQADDIRSILARRGDHGASE